MLIADLIEPEYDKTIKMTCAPSENSDQPGHPPSLGVRARRTDHCACFAMLRLIYVINYLTGQVQGFNFNFEFALKHLSNGKLVLTCPCAEIFLGSIISQLTWTMYRVQKHRIWCHINQILIRLRDNEVIKCGDRQWCDLSLVRSEEPSVV